MALVEIKKGVAMMMVMFMLVLALAGDITSFTQGEDIVDPESRLGCTIFCPLRCNPLQGDVTQYGECVAQCWSHCKKIMSKVDINHCIEKYHATGFSNWKDVSNIDDRDGVNTYVNSFLEDCKSK